MTCSNPEQGPIASMIPPEVLIKNCLIFKLFWAILGGLEGPHHLKSDQTFKKEWAPCSIAIIIHFRKNNALWGVQKKICPTVTTYSRISTLWKLSGGKLSASQKCTLEIFTSGQMITGDSFVIVGEIILYHWTLGRQFLQNLQKQTTGTVFTNFSSSLTNPSGEEERLLPLRQLLLKHYFNISATCGQLPSPVVK